MKRIEIQNFINRVLNLDLSLNKPLKISYAFDEDYGKYVIYHNSKEFIYDELIQEKIEDVFEELMIDDMGFDYNPEKVNLMSEEINSYINENEALLFSGKISLNTMHTRNIKANKITHAKKADNFNENAVETINENAGDTNDMRLIKLAA